ncbi:hypothetical protein [Marilutibacter maris]|uniref:hypothetical protein n=1 Tax=Marilutibacter maris TaxID=1605891 RepID=UPI000DA8E082|nr:hypothetical protein [Lysobacter maris]
MLRVSGSTVKVRRFLATSSIQPSRVFWKGDPGTPKSRGPIKISGFNIELSGADGIVEQAAQASQFIRRHKQDFLLIRSLGFSAATIDFGLYDLATEDRPWPCYRIPHPLVLLASELGCSIELSFYGMPPDAS